MGCSLSTSSEDDLTALSPPPISLWSTALRPTSLIRLSIPNVCDFDLDAWPLKPIFSKHWTCDDLITLFEAYKKYSDDCDENRYVVVDPVIWIPRHYKDSTDDVQRQAAFELHCLLHSSYLPASRPHTVDGLGHVLTGISGKDPNFAEDPPFNTWTQTMKEDLGQYFCQEDYLEVVIGQMRIAYPLRTKLFSPERVNKMIQWLKINGYIEREGERWIVPKQI